VDAGADAGVDAGLLCACLPPNPLCDAQGNCVACLTDAACTLETATPHCDTDLASAAYGLCVPCAAVGQCGAGLACELDTNQCVASCLGAEGTPCNAGSYCSASTGLCASGCLTASNCSDQLGGPLCDTVTHACVQCLTAADCSPGAPFCLGGICVPCDGGCALDGGLADAGAVGDGGSSGDAGSEADAGADGGG
jgi:hypothetical protein